MEIRARLNLEIAKFKANTKIVASQFRAMSTGAKRFSDNVDHYAKRSIKTTQQINAQRVQDTSRTGQAILAKEKQIADNRYSVIMQGARKAQRDKSKLELEAVRNTGGIRAGTNVSRPLLDTSLQRKENLRYHEWLRKANQRTIQEQTANAYAQLRREIPRRIALEQTVSKRITAAQASEAVKAFAYRKAYDVRYLAGKVAMELASLQKIAAANKATTKQMKQDALKNQVEFFNSDKFNSRLAAMRYALYDVSRRATMFGVAVAGALAAAVKSAIDFESAFTAVERTTQLSLTSNIPQVQGQAQELRDTLIQLTTEIPVAFADITQIATLGAQMGIAAQDVDAFTETVARFASITKIGVEEVALSFGRIAQLLDVDSSQFEQLSSAIAFTGVNSVATDKEILKMSESIGAAATNAGFAADETIGFAAALASLKVRPEEARGVLTRLFREFDLSVSAGGSKLDDLARLIGKTSEDAAGLWKQDPSQFVQSFLRSANATGQLNKVITALGITNSRELNVITRLANNMGVLEQALSDSSEQFEMGTFSTEAYGLVVDDVSSKITMLQNSVAAMGASFAEELLPFVALAVDALREFIDNLAAAPGASKTAILVIGSLTAGLALLAGGAAATVAGLFALKLIITEMGVRAGASAAGVGAFKAMLISLIPGATGATGVLSALSLSAANAGRSFMAASVGVKLFTAALGIIAIAGAIAVGIASFAGAAENAKAKVKELTDANFEAAGGFEAFSRASQEGLQSGAKVYDTVTDSVSRLSAEQIAERKSALGAAKAKAELTKNTEAGAQAYVDATKKLDEFNAEVERSNGLVEKSTLAFTENTKEVIANALAKISVEGQDEPLNIFEEIYSFDTTKLSTSAKASLEASGIDFVQILNDSIEAAMSGEMTAVQYMEQQFANVDLQVGMRNSKDLTDFVEKMLVAGGATDGLISSAKDANAVVGIMGQVIGDAGADAEDMGEGFVDLNDVLKDTITRLTAVGQAEGKVASALDTFAQGALETAGEMDGLGEAARTNLSNFASFMDAAVEASIAAGEGTSGAVRRIVQGLYALEQAGINSSDAFVLARQIIVDNLIMIIPALSKVRDELGKQTSLAGMEQAIRAIYAAKIAAAGTLNQIVRFKSELSEALSVLTGFGAGYQVSFSSADKATEKTITKLEKLQSAIAKLFSWTNKRMALQDSINSLGESMEENGNTFSIWSESGRQNVGALLDAIDNMATMANGDMQLFANQLGAMRAALVKVGAPASALKLIDDALKLTGKRAKVSKKEVENFYKELASSKDAERSLAQIASAVGEVQSAIKASISAYFAQQNAIDDITLGWLDMADAAETAREAVADAGETIEDARRSIDEANASIQELSAKSNTLEYQLQIALKYGDQLRADEIRAEIASINADIAGQQDNIADANRDIANAQEAMAEANGRLGIGSTTRQFIEQNRALQDLASKYADATAWMLATAGEGADLNAIIEAQTTDFYNNAIQMGYTEQQARDVADVLRTQLIASMDEIPEDITTEVSAETAAALAKVTKFAADANARLATIKDKTITVTTRYVTVPVPGAGSGGGGSVIRAATGGLITGPGTGTSDSITAKVSNGEYVVKAAAVSRYGVDFFNAINQMQVPQRGFQVGNVAAAGSQTVYLSPEDRQLLRQAIDRPVALYTDNATIARSANEGNAILAQRGIR